MSFFRNPATGRLVIAQPPNLPLAVYLVGAILRAFVDLPFALDALVTFALIWWGVLEVADGDSQFRRVLGAVVLVATVR